MNPFQERLFANLAGNRLYLILLPTEACNFQCLYCYERSGGSRMEAPVLWGLKNFLGKRVPGLDHLAVSWFGGEPLLAKDLIEDVMGHIHGLIERHPRMSLMSNMTTNAYLLSKQVFERMLALGITDYQITLDGPKEWHDRKRVLPRGGGTFDRIWKNVTDIRGLPGEFTVCVRVHVDRENLEAMPEFISKCRDALGDDPRFIFFFRALSRLGGARDDELCVLEGGLEDERIKRIRGEAAVRGLGAQVDDRRLPMCYASSANSFVVRADGSLNKCSVAMHQAINRVGRLNDDGTVDLDRPLMLEWIRGLFTNDPGALQCPLKGFDPPGAMD